MGTGLSRLANASEGFFATGDAQDLGEGVAEAVHGIVGGLAASGAKITGSVERILWGFAGGMPADLRRSLAAPGPPSHLGEGLHVAGHVLLGSVSYGLYNLAERPYQGYRQDHCQGLISGAAYGVLGCARGASRRGVCRARRRGGRAATRGGGCACPL
jgi:hypothetical protein